jgi:hypothetical protein
MQLLLQAFMHLPVSCNAGVRTGSVSGALDLRSLLRAPGAALPTDPAGGGSQRLPTGRWGTVVTADSTTSPDADAAGTGVCADLPTLQILRWCSR